MVFTGIKGIKEELSSGHYSFVVIDEAHHAAANSYLPIFKDQYGQQTQMGVLGLTATPSRHDGVPLDFEEEIYSISFGELVDRGVILLPEIIKIKGEEFTDIHSLHEEGDLDRFNTVTRNQKIIDALIEGKDTYNKVVIYVGTHKHLDDLYEQCKSSNLKDYYPAIDWIKGGEKNSRQIGREEFIKQMGNEERSILINVDVLTEGFDDPAIDTVVMGRQTNSMLIYFQAMGRCVRQASDKRKAYLIEIEDDMPNIQYYMDNRWLSLEVSAALEPLVEDFHYSDESNLKSTLNDIYDQYDVKPELRIEPKFEPEARYGILLFKVYVSADQSHHIPLLLTSKTKIRIRPVFQYLSERLAHSKDLYKKNRASAVFNRWIEQIGDIRNFRENLDAIWQAMRNAGKTISRSPYTEDVPSTIKAHKSRDKSWITYISLTQRRDDENDWEEFISDMLNDNEIRSSLLEGFRSESVIIKIPLGLGGCIGKIISSQEFETIRRSVDTLVKLTKENSDRDYSSELHKLIGDFNLPIENKYHQGIPLIIRDDLVNSYYFKL